MFLLKNFRQHQNLNINKQYNQLPSTAVKTFRVDTNPDLNTGFAKIITCL